jgi:cytochrome c-type biogenesis protein CcmH
MTTFLFSSILLALLAFASMAWPLLRRRSDDAPDGQASPALAALRRQRREIEEDFLRGAISAEERDQVRADLVYLADEELRLGAPAPAAAVRRSSPRIVLAALLLLLPLIVIPLYLKVGTPAALDPAARAPRALPALKNMETAVQLLEKKMEQRPNDPTGWVLLGRTRFGLGRYAESVSAFEKANALKPNEPDILCDYAEAVARTQDKSLTGKPMALAQQALAADPHHRRALALAATAEFNEKHIEASLGYWRRLQKEYREGSDEWKQIADMMEDVKSGNAGRANGASTPAPGK